jgi:hypothetical protein
VTEGQDPSAHEQRGQEQPGQEAVGSAAEEAAKLFGALGDWAKLHSGDVANNLAVGLTTGLAGLASHAQAAAAEAGHSLNENLATGAPECTYCPICRTVHIVREASPEVIAHLATAAASLMQAASAVLAAAAGSGQGSRRSATVEKIDLDMDQGWSDDWPTETEGNEP